MNLPKARYEHIRRALKKIQNVHLAITAKGPERWHPFYVGPVDMVIWEQEIKGSIQGPYWPRDFII